MADEREQLEQIARTLANIETMYGEMLRKQDEDRAESKERQKQFDAEHAEFRERQKDWNERDNAFTKLLNPWIQPGHIANLLLMVALLTLALKVFLQK